MGVERQVIYPFVKDMLLRHRFDYEALQVGDWFIVKSKAYRSLVNYSMARNPTARSMTFEFHELEPRVWKVERTS